MREERREETLPSSLIGGTKKKDTERERIKVLRGEAARVCNFSLSI
jgi:hypothetical protein